MNNKQMKFLVSTFTWKCYCTSSTSNFIIPIVVTTDIFFLKKNIDILEHFNG